MAMDTDQARKTWEKCSHHVETCCLFRQKLRILEIARAAAARNEPRLAPRAMHERMLETTTNDGLCCPVANGGSCPFSTRPKYDAELCELSVHSVIILRLHKRRKQHSILCEFEKQGDSATPLL
jgi:hypothetical protein